MSLKLGGNKLFDLLVAEGLLDDGGDELSIIDLFVDEGRPMRRPGVIVAQICRRKTERSRLLARCGACWCPHALCLASLYFPIFSPGRTHLTDISIVCARVFM